MGNPRVEIYESVASLRLSTFELLDRMPEPGDEAAGDLASAIAVRLQAVANQLGAVEALVAPVTDRQ